MCVSCVSVYGCLCVQKSKEKPVRQNVQELCHFEKRNGGAGGRPVLGWQVEFCLLV